MITAALTLEQGDGTIIATDSTIYGSPTRAEVNVDFEVYRKVDESETKISLSYNSSTVGFIEFPVTDGWYKVVMTITNSSTGTIESTVTEQYIVTTGLEACKQERLRDYACHCCDDKAFLDYAKLEAALEAISVLVAKNLYKSAYCILAAVSLLCENQNCNNGC